WHSTAWHALVLDGASSISLPVPREIAGPGADFTIEMWVRFDARFPESRLLLAGPLELHTLRPRLEIGGAPSMLMADLKSGPLGIAVRAPVLGDRWHHWAVVRAGRQLKLFVDGQSRAALPLEDSFAIGAPTMLVGGRGFQSGPNLRGMVREIRVSRGARYAQPFRPPLRLAKDDQTLVLPKFTAAKGDTIEDLSGHGHHGARGTAQWLPLTVEEGIVQAELPPDHLDLKRTFSASIHTLRGTTENNPAFCDSTNVKGVCQMLIPYQPLGDYDLDLEVTRLEGEGGLLFGLTLGPDGKQLALAIEAFPDQGGPYTGILPSELTAVAPRACLAKHEPKLVTGKQQRVVVHVRNPATNRYSVRVTIDGFTVCNVSDFLGNSILPGALKMPQKSALFLGSYDAKVRYHSIKLLPARTTSASTDVASSGNTGTGGSVNPLVPAVSAASATTSAPTTATAAMSGKAWLAEGAEKLAVRMTRGRWVELRESEHSWYVVRDASPSEFLLADPVRNVDLRLRDTEVAFRTPSQDWALLGPGRWVDVAQLPAFAQRTPSAVPTSPASQSESPWHALAFDGRSALRMTLPSEITPEQRDFTVEAWLRFDPWPQGSLIRLMNVGSLAMYVGPQRGPVPSEGRELHLIFDRTVHRFPLPVRAERWTHLALVRQANELRLYCDGKPVKTFNVSDRFTLDGNAQTLVFGQTGGGSSSGFKGHLRDFRVSKAARYAAPFTPPLRFPSDESTLILPKFESDSQDAVQDLSPSGAKINRDQAQWTALTVLGELTGRASVTPPPPATVQNPPTIGQPPAVTARRPVPAPDELARRLAEARKIFEEQLKEAVRPAQKAALAKTILTAADNTRSDTDARYVLIDLARKVFVQAGEVNDSLAAAKLLEKEFDVAVLSLIVATIEALDATTLPPEERSILAKTAIELAEELLDDEDYDGADKLSTIATQSANKQKDAELRKDIVQRRGQLARVTNAARAALPSFELLKTKPDDRAANLAAGKFRCFVLEDWEAGLPLLAKGGDPLFATPASLDVTSSSGKSDALVAAGEAWLKLAADTKAISREDRPAIQRRARQQLTAGLAGTVGLERVRIEKRLEELKGVDAASPRRNTRARISRAAVLPGLIGRVVVRGQDAGIIVTYQPGYTVTQEDVQKLQAAAGATPSDPLRIDLIGVLTLATDAQLEVRHAGGSSSGGVHTFFLSSQNISEIGDDRSKDDTRTLPLVKGQHPLRWVLTGGDLGTALLSLVPVDTAGKPLPGAAAVQYSRDMNVLARSVPYRQEIKWGTE
ncbi:MAG: LamG domain-containing protein, partial [Planctomycetaceae bacterium]|nr:LamG domain-containing protein [Planctomycetaceae bacterium]